MRIGYYVHHHGRGHATRAGVLGAVARARGHEVTYLGSEVLPEGSQVRLMRDDRAADAPFRDADAGRRLHWGPLGGGYAERSAQIAGWVAQARPDVVVVDVSVEVTALVRLLGVPVVVVGQPGTRDDAPHDLAFALAAAVIAPWPAGLDVARHLGHLRERVHEVGGVSRFAAQGDSSSHRDGHDGRAMRGVLLVGGEGWDDAGLPDAVRAAVPEVDWREPGPETPIETLLAEADVVVTHAGQNALADVACFEVATVVVPQERPFDEQADMARALDAAGIARGVTLGADAGQIASAVREVLASAQQGPAFGPSWRAWNVVGAPERAVDVIETVGRSGSTPRVAVVTPVRGRLEHLVNQRRFLTMTAPEALHVVVAVDSPDLEAELSGRDVGAHASAGGLVVEHLPGDPLGMPTARARNLGAQRALDEGADLIVFLDVDCVPLPGMIDALVDAASTHSEAVLNAVVTYLPDGSPLDAESPDTAARFIDPHPVRPAPDAGDVAVDDAHHLLWSLAFALTAASWRACGGFDEVYVGYGAEDTDFGMRARAARLPMAWVGGAHALHQWHPSANPPVHHVVDIVRNANLYRERWGVWPMEGWLRAFADQGLVDWGDDHLDVVRSDC